MWWTDQIFSIIWNISTLFYNLASTTSTWVWPFYYISTPFYAIGDLFWAWLEPIANFGVWADDVWARVQKVLDEEGVLSLILWVFPWLTDVGNWFATRWEWFLAEANEWWAAISLEVKGWIEIARQTLQALINDLTTWLATLQAAWDDFWTETWPEWTAKLDILKAGWDAFWVTTFPTLANWTGVQSLIDSALRTWFPFYDDLIAIWNEVVEFFTNPLEFLLTRLTDWFLGPEE